MASSPFPIFDALVSGAAGASGSAALAEDLFDTGAYFQHDQYDIMTDEAKNSYRKMLRRSQRVNERELGVGIMEQSVIFSRMEEGREGMVNRRIMTRYDNNHLRETEETPNPYQLPALQYEDYQVRVAEFIEFGDMTEHEIAMIFDAYDASQPSQSLAVTPGDMNRFSNFIPSSLGSGSHSSISSISSSDGYVMPPTPEVLSQQPLSQNPFSQPFSSSPYGTPPLSQDFADRDEFMDYDEDHALHAAYLQSARRSQSQRSSGRSSGSKEVLEAQSEEEKEEEMNESAEEAERIAFQGWRERGMAEMSEKGIRKLGRRKLKTQRRKRAMERKVRAMKQGKRNRNEFEQSGSGGNTIGQDVSSGVSVLSSQSSPYSQPFSIPVYSSPKGSALHGRGELARRDVRSLISTLKSVQKINPSLLSPASSSSSSSQSSRHSGDGEAPRVFSSDQSGEAQANLVTDGDVERAVLSRRERDEEKQTQRTLERLSTRMKALKGMTKKMIMERKFDQRKIESIRRAETNAAKERMQEKIKSIKRRKGAKSIEKQTRAETISHQNFDRQASAVFSNYPVLSSEYAEPSSVLLNLFNTIRFSRHTTFISEQDEAVLSRTRNLASSLLEQIFVHPSVYRSLDMQNVSVFSSLYSASSPFSFFSHTPDLENDPLVIAGRQYGKRQ